MSEHTPTPGETYVTTRNMYVYIKKDDYYQFVIMDTGMEFVITGNSKAHLYFKAIGEDANVYEIHHTNFDCCKLIK